MKDIGVYGVSVEYFLKFLDETLKRHTLECIQELRGLSSDHDTGKWKELLATIPLRSSAKSARFNP